MNSFLVDQNFNEHIVDGLTPRDATMEFTHARDVGLAAVPDLVILEWYHRSLGLVTARSASSRCPPVGP